MNTPPDSWSGPIAMWVWTLGNWLFGGVSGIHVLMMVATLVWTVIKAANELTRRRILDRAAAAQCQPGAHPMRRATDLVNRTGTTPGSLEN